MKRAPLVTTLLILIFALVPAGIALADQTYTVAGRDTFSIGAGDIRSEISYVGTQTLSVHRHGHLTRYRAHVIYRRSDGTASTAATGEYLADIADAGNGVDSANGDPDYLTVLNQPFAAQLDPPTLADLRHLKGAVPFDFPSPITGASLHGYLKRAGAGTIGRHGALGVSFEAAGPMSGALPDRPGLRLNGTITMHGVAYYDLRSALLLTLDTTVTITGNVSNRLGKDPVTITYARLIRAATAPAVQASSAAR